MALSDFFAALLRVFTRSSAPSHADTPPAAAAQPLPVSPSKAPGAAPAPATAVAAPAPMPAAVPTAMTPADFIATIGPAAQTCARRTGVPASVTVAQAALESSWGKNCPGFNLFGIKADSSWSGPFTTQETHEVVRGQTILITAEFRAYQDWNGSIEDHAAFLVSNPRYKPAFATQNAVEFAKQLQACGYATDPLYADKLISIMSTRNLAALDTQEAHA